MAEQRELKLQVHSPELKITYVIIIVYINTTKKFFNNLLLHNLKK